MFFTRLKVITSADFAEILMAEVAEAGFDTFMENENGFEAYGEEARIDHALLESIRTKYAHVQPLLFFTDKIKKQNWNKEWEKNVEPIIVEDQCLIRASFHNIPKKYPYEIVITPKMSFGTGHHQTTYLMVKNQMSIDHKNKMVMDAGCGTAILSVMASKRGAKKVEAFDMDEWSVPNGVENAETNNCSNINIRQGTIRDFLWPIPFDIILANINKNVLLDEMQLYSQNLIPGGLLLLSGFYVQDIPDLEGAAGKAGLRPQRRDERETWAALLLEKVQ
ncbi:MAG TPA: 50S ribosomal protein L11 methyltransferase [Cyclobacteriaceae bacterium]|nr:50S ribosomal protein L11 methyltransferase [Cyclobacteriaceae bacterium]